MIYEKIKKLIKDYYLTKEFYINEIKEKNNLVLFSFDCKELAVGIPYNYLYDKNKNEILPMYLPDKNNFEILNDFQNAKIIYKREQGE